MTRHLARCHCGALEVACEGEPRKVSLCHCEQCQRRTGSAFSVAVFYAREQVAVRGATSSFMRPSASGFEVDFRFCPACGSNLLWYPARMPALVGVAFGGFADRDFPMPDQAVWAEEGHDWVGLPDQVTSFARNPPPRR
ncbi:GFA family protein [Sphingomonas sp.]|uniref:GFA family protein n=1 Tax=Sphingomonas sp. TaxID=28214 RepID=UPI0025CE532D|nr:GFA family protein [Sphingomonas sp.]